VKDSDIIAAIAPDAVSLMDKAIAEIKRLRQENATLTAERDEAREQAERWEDDALRLMKERNKALEERDAARRAYCMAAYRLDPKGESTPMSIAQQQGWDCFRKDGGNA
jgi:FtsZ-binding cell division protein ZapB